MQTLRTAGLVLLLAVLACGDDAPTEPPPPPPPPFELEVEGTLESFTLDPETNESRCDYRFTARASGGADGEYAEWRDGEIEWEHGGGQSSDLHLSEQDIIDRWGSSRIHTGEMQEFGRYTTSTGEFVLFYTFRYELASGETGTAIVGIGCEA